MGRAAPLTRTGTPRTIAGCDGGEAKLEEVEVRNGLAAIGAMIGGLALAACGTNDAAPDTTANGMTAQPAAEAPIALPPESANDMDSEISDNALNAAFGSTEVENASEANRDD